MGHTRRCTPQTFCFVIFPPTCARLPLKRSLTYSKLRTFLPCRTGPINVSPGREFLRHTLALLYVRSLIRVSKSCAVSPDRRLAEARGLPRSFFALKRASNIHSSSRASRNRLTTSPSFWLTYSTSGSTIASLILRIPKCCNKSTNASEDFEGAWLHASLNRRCDIESLRAIKGVRSALGVNHPTCSV